MILDRPTDDPALTLQRTVGGVPLFSRHPWNFLMMADSYEELASPTSTHKIVRVDYRFAPIISERTLGVHAGWDIEFLGLDIPIQLLQEVPPGTRFIGSPTFRKTQAGESSPLYAEVEGLPVSLIETGFADDEGVPSSLAAAQLNLHKITNGFLLGNSLLLASYKNTVNDGYFYGAPHGHVKFTDYVIRTQSGTAFHSGSGLGNPITSLSWDVTLQFMYSFTRLDIERRFARFQQNDGSFTPVYFGGLRYYYDFLVAEARNFAILMGLFP